MNCAAEGPFYEGVNSLMANYNVDLKSLLELDDFEENKLKQVRLKNVTIALSEESGMKMVDFNNAALQIVSNEIEMTSVAVKNPLVEQGLTTELGVSEEVDISDYFKQDLFTMVLDLDLKEDAYVELLSATLSVELEFTYNQ